MSKKTIMYFMLLLFFFIQVQAAAHQPHDEVRRVAVSPAFASDKTVFCSVSHVNTFIMKTTDGGLTWSPSQIGFPHSAVSSIAISPAYDIDATVFVGTDNGSVFKSTDGGNSWVASDSGIPYSRVMSLAISPYYEFDQVVFAGTAGRGVYRSIDGGSSWQACNEGMSNLIVLSLSISNDQTIFAATNGGVFASLDGAQSWIDLTPIEFEGFPVAAVAVSPTYSQDQTVFVGLWGLGMFKSEDGGMTWTGHNNGITDDYITSVAFSPGYTIDQTLLVSSRTGGIFKSTDGGNIWLQINEGLRRQAAHVQPHYFGFSFSPDFEQDQIVFLASLEGLHKSEDNVEKWRHLNVYNQNFVRALAISPNYATDGMVLAGCYGGGMYRTDDYGESWLAVDTGLSNLYMADIAVSPNHAQDNTIFASNSWGVFKSVQNNTWIHNKVHPTDEIYIRSMGISPDYANDLTLFAGNGFNSGSANIYRTADGGETYLPLTDEFDSSSWITVVSPDYANDQTVFVGTSRGVFRSQNGGNDWDHIAQGQNKIFLALAVSPVFPSDGVVFAGTMNEGIFKSTDRGETWVPVNTGLDGLVIEAISISPEYETDQTVFAATKSRGLYKSTNGGESWQYVGLEGTFIRRIAVSPAFPADQTIFLGTLNTVLRTRNGGMTWESVLDIHRYDERSLYGTVQGNWTLYHHVSASGPGLAYANESSASAEMTFLGSSIKWIGGKAFIGGMAEVYVDGVSQGVVDLYASTTRLQEVLFSKNNLGPGIHSIEIVVTGDKNPASFGTYVFVDAFEVGD